MHYVYHNPHILVDCIQGWVHAYSHPRQRKNTLSSSFSDCHRFGLFQYFLLRDYHYHQPASLDPVHNLIVGVFSVREITDSCVYLPCALTRLAAYNSRQRKNILTVIYFFILQMYMGTQKYLKNVFSYRTSHNMA